jgi:hypothetical protein
MVPPRGWISAIALKVELEQPAGRASSQLI